MLTALTTTLGILLGVLAFIVFLTVGLIEVIRFIFGGRKKNKKAE